MWERSSGIRAVLRLKLMNQEILLADPSSCFRISLHGATSSIPKVFQLVGDVGRITNGDLVFCIGLVLLFQDSKLHNALLIPCYSGSNYVVLAQFNAQCPMWWSLIPSKREETTTYYLLA